VRVEVPFPRPLLAGQFVCRLNRFAALVRVGGELWTVHLPNSGRMQELLVAGARVRVQPGPLARTRGKLLLALHHGRWVGLDSHLPNRLWERAMRCGGLPPVVGVRGWEREVQVGSERLDFRVRTDRGVWFVEVKSCNRVEGGVALFPDAPTQRGARHLLALARRARRGGRAAVVWFVQRDDATSLHLDPSDPLLVAAAARARLAGVRLVAYTCTLSPAGAAVGRRIPVRLGGWHPTCA